MDLSEDLVREESESSIVGVFTKKNKKRRTSRDTATVTSRLVVGVPRSVDGFSGFSTRSRW